MRKIVNRFVPFFNLLLFFALSHLRLSLAEGRGDGPDASEHGPPMGAQVNIGDPPERNAAGHRSVFGNSVPEGGHHAHPAIA